MGAILAGAKNCQVLKLHKYGMKLGRAFQIKDDIIGTFAESSETGKSNLTDIAEAKRTLLIWHAYKHCDNAQRKIIDTVFSGPRTGRDKLNAIRKIMIESGSLDYAKREITLLLNESGGILNSSGMKDKYLLALQEFSKATLIV
jgi:geranylgeranyl diphosphate synthase type I